MIEQTLRGHLLSIFEVATLVDSRIYPQKLPQGATLPAITYSRIFREGMVTHEGDMSLARTRIQLDCWANRYRDVAELARAVGSSLNGHSGPMGSNPQVSIRVVGGSDLDEPNISIYRRLIEIAIWHEED